jgi:HSP20 family molecular chaperone IbpA
VSNDITATIKTHQAKLNNLHRHNKREVDHVETNHEKRVAEIKKDHEIQIQNVRDDNREKISVELDKKEKALAELKKSLDQTQKLTLSEQKRLQAHHQHRSQEIQTGHQERVSAIVEKNENQIQDLNERFNSKITVLQKQSEMMINDQEERARTRLNNQKDLYTDKIQSQRQNFQSTLEHEDKKFSSQLERQKSTIKRTLTNAEKDGQVKLAQTSEKYVKLNQQATEHQQKSAAEREQLFEKKFQTQLAHHTEIEKNLDGRHTQFLNETKDKLNERVALEEQKSQDSFFKFTELKPTVTPTPEGYEVRVKVPEYAKEEVKLTTNVKELVLTANRRHQDERTSENGVQQKVSKVESLVSRIPVDHVLHARKMTQEWVNGELIFKVFKA